MSGLSELAVVTGALTALVAVFAVWLLHHDYILSWGDAQSHLNLSRSIIDSRTPGYDQLGTVWLPLLHLICLPFVRNDWLWTTGLAGTIPVAVCFVIAGACFYFAAKEAYGGVLSAVVVLACFALNPNVLYLAAIPMTEVVFLAALSAALLAMLRFARTAERKHLAWGVLASWCMSLTRYDGWFLIPFIALGFVLGTRERRWLILIGFGAAGSIAPLYWMAHNWWETSNALDFYNGPYSPVAIQGGKTYPGYQDWILALKYYGAAGNLCAGWALGLLGFLGTVCAIVRKAFLPGVFLLLTPAFYVWSMHSSKGSPIFVPALWPHGYYNTRYGIAMVVFEAFAAGAITLLLPPNYKRFAVAIPLLAVLPWLVAPSAENWICWKESQKNTPMAWTGAGDSFIRRNYVHGQGILTSSSSGDLAGIFCRTGIHLAETLNEGNGPAWLVASTQPDLYHPSVWVVAEAGRPLANAVKSSKFYHLAKGSSSLEIYRRNK